VNHFVQKCAERQGTPPPRVSDEMMSVMKAYRWPGNVRELQNAVERAFALCDNGVFLLKDLPERVLETVAGINGAAPTTFSKSSTLSSAARPDMPEGAIDTTLAEMAAGAAQWSRGLPPMQLKEFLHGQEVNYIEQVIQSAGGDKEKAAHMLGISMATLYRKLAPSSEELTAVEKSQPQL
jgi:DNA-binding NtrC family response regulator